MEDKSWEKFFDKLNTLEKRVADLEQQLAERPKINEIGSRIVSALKASGIKVGLENLESPKGCDVMYNPATHEFEKSTE